MIFRERGRGAAGYPLSGKKSTKKFLTAFLSEGQKPFTFPTISDRTEINNRYECKFNLGHGNRFTNHP